MIDVIALSACIIGNHISAGSKGGVATLVVDYFIELLTLEELTHLMHLDRRDPFGRDVLRAGLALLKSEP